MEKFLSFFRSHKKIILGVTGGLVLVGMVVFVALGGLGSKLDDLVKQGKVEEAVAEYSRLMETKPSAVTAAKMLDIAIDANKHPLVLKILKEQVHPWLTVPGVTEEFVRGARWYIQWASPGEGLFWLEDEVRKAAPETNLNPELASAYSKVKLAVEQVRLGNRLFIYWDLDQSARDTYLQAIGSLLTGFSLEPLTFPSHNQSLIAEVPESLTRFPEFELVPDYLTLWLRSHQGDLEQKDLTALNMLAREPEPLGIYWRLRASVLLHRLGKGWSNPLGLDVTDEITEVFGQISTLHHERILTLLQTNIDPGSTEQALIFMELVARPGLDSKWGGVSLANFLKARGFKDEDLAKCDSVRPYIINPGIILNPRSEAVLKKLRELYGQESTFQCYATHVRPLVDNSLKLFREKSLYDWPQTSPTQASILFQEPSGVILFNLLTWKTDSYPGWQGAWSPKGDRFVLMKTSGLGTDIRIIAADGKQLSEFRLTTGFPDLNFTDSEGSKLNYKAGVQWWQPGVLTVQYFLNDGEYREPLQEPLPIFTVDLGQKTVTKLTGDLEPPWWAWVPGVNLYRSGSGLYDEAGLRVTDILSNQSKYVFTDHESEIYSEEGKLFFKNSEGINTLFLSGDSSSTINWVARVSDRVYLCFGSNILLLDPVAGQVVYADTELWHNTPQVSLAMNQETSVFPASNYLSSWLNVYNEGFYVTDYVLSVGDISFCWGGDWDIIGVVVYKASDRYFVIMQAGTLHGDDAETWVLEFR